MKIIKFKQKRSYSYKRKILIKDLVLKMLVGIHNFEKKKKQRVRFNLIINIDQNLIPNDKDLKSIVNYEQVIKTIMKITSIKIRFSIIFFSKCDKIFICIGVFYINSNSCLR